jgi:hypothetical protein
MYLTPSVLALQSSCRKITDDNWGTVTLPHVALVSAYDANGNRTTSRP